MRIPVKSVMETTYKNKDRNMKKKKKKRTEIRTNFLKTIPLFPLRETMKVPQNTRNRSTI